MVKIKVHAYLSLSMPRRHIITEAIVVASKEIGLEVNVDKTKYMVMSGDQNAVKCNTIKIDNSSFERVEQFKCLGTTLTNKNSIQEEINSRLKLGNAESSLFQFAIQKFKDQDI